MAIEESNDNFELVLSRYHLCYYCCVRDTYHITHYYRTFQGYSLVSMTGRKLELWKVESATFIPLHIIQLHTFVSIIQFNYKRIVKLFQNNLT